MLTREHGDQLFCDVDPFLEAAFIDHGEAVADEFPTPEPDIEIHVLAAGTGRLPHNGTGDDVTGCEFAAFVVPVHKPFSVFVEQGRAFSPDRLRDEKPLPPLGSSKGRGMELHQAQIFDAGAQFMGQGDAVAGGDGGVGGIGIYPSDAARAQDTVGTGQHPGLVPNEELRPEAALPGTRFTSWA